MAESTYIKSSELASHNRRSKDDVTSKVLNLEKIGRDCIVGLKFQTSDSFSVSSRPRLMSGLTHVKDIHPHSEV